MSEVVVTYLESTSREELRPAPAPERFSVRRIDPPDPELNRRMYLSVGSDYQWTMRRGWSPAQWARWACRPGTLETFVGEFEGELCGYFELERQEKGSVEIAYFGMLPRFIGRRLGGPLLTRAIEEAWALGGKRVWVHTCTLDHPHALQNYQARGLRVFRTEVEKQG